MKSYLINMRNRILPLDEDVGWFPFLWLIYLSGFIYEAIVIGDPMLQGMAGIGLCVFLVLYFRGFWLNGFRILLIMGGIISLGLVFTPFFSSAIVFFIYGASFSGRLGKPGHGLLSLIPIIVIAFVWAEVIDLHRNALIPTIVFTALIGVISIYESHLNRKKAQLRLSQEEVRHLAAMAERERISRDLHDLLGHTLSVITLKSELAVKLMDRKPERAREEMVDVEQISRQTLKQVREAVQGYRTSGLGGELANARLAFEAMAIRFSYTDVPTSLPPEQEAVLAMAVREAATNIIRHAQASVCDIRFESTKDRLHLYIEDDGKGGKVVEGAGLMGMRERLQEIGGSLDILSEKGWRLHLSLPQEPIIQESQWLEAKKEASA